MWATDKIFSKVFKEKWKNWQSYVALYLFFLFLVVILKLYNSFNYELMYNDNHIKFHQDRFASFRDIGSIDFEGIVVRKVLNIFGPNKTTDFFLNLRMHKSGIKFK